MKHAWATYSEESAYPVRVNTPDSEVPLTTDEAKQFLLELAGAIRSAEARKPIKTIPIVEVRNAA